jgi:hypothetical protein
VRRARASALVLLLLGAPGAAAAGGVTAQARAAWDGVARPGRFTEVVVDVVSDAGGAVGVEADAGGGVFTTERTVDAGVPGAIRLPVRVGEAGAVTVVVRPPAGDPAHLTVPLRQPAPDEWVVARPRSLAAADFGTATHHALVVDLDPVSMPETAAALEGVDLLVVDDPLLAALSKPAFVALRAYLGICGRLLGVALTHPATTRAHAGCHRTMVETIPAGAPIGPAAASLLERRGAEPRAALAALAATLPAAAKRPLLGFFALYGVVLLLVAAAVRRVWMLAAIPFLLAALLAVTLGWLPPAATLVALVETDSGAPSARFLARVVVDGIGVRHATIGVSSVLGVPALEPPDAGRVAIERARAVVTVSAPLLARRTIEYEGIVPWRAPLLFVVGAGGPEVRAVRPVGAGWVVSDGQVRALPALAGGEAWSATGTPALDPATLPAWLDALRGAQGKEDPAFAVVPAVPEIIAPFGATAPPLVWTLVHPGGNL